MRFGFRFVTVDDEILPVNSFSNSITHLFFTLGSVDTSASIFHTNCENLWCAILHNISLIVRIFLSILNGRLLRLEQETLATLGWSLRVGLDVDALLD